MKAPLASRRAPPGARGVVFGFGRDVWEAGEQTTKRLGYLVYIGECITYTTIGGGFKGEMIQVD